MNYRHQTPQCTADSYLVLNPPTTLTKSASSFNLISSCQTDSPDRREKNDREEGFFFCVCVCYCCREGEQGKMGSSTVAHSKGREGKTAEREEIDNSVIHSGPSSRLLLGHLLASSPLPHSSLLPPPPPTPGPSGVLLTPLCQPSEVLSLSGRPSQISSLLKRPGRPGWRARKGSKWGLSALLNASPAAWHKREGY